MRPVGGQGSGQPPAEPPQVPSSSWSLLQALEPRPPWPGGNLTPLGIKILGLLLSGKSGAWFLGSHGPPLSLVLSPPPGC